MIPNEYFDKIYVLNIKRRESQWNSLQQRLNREDIIVERFEGIDLKNLENDYQKYLKTHLSWSKNWTIGNFAILNSFIKLYTYINNENNLDRILILEDDSIFHKDFKNLFNIHSKEIPSDWDFWYLGNCSWEGFRDIKISENFIFNESSSGNFGLGIRYKNIKEILRALKSSYLNGSTPTDITINRNFIKNNKYKAFISNPNLIKSSYGFSETANQEISSKNWLRKEKIGRWYDENLYH